MTRPSSSLFLRAAVVVLILAVLLCLVLPMTGQGMAEMQFAMFCCFVLAIVLAVFILRQPAPTLLLGGVPGAAILPSHGPPATARAPDLSALGSLLI